MPEQIGKGMWCPWVVKTGKISVESLTRSLPLNAKELSPPGKMLEEALSMNELGSGTMESLLYTINSGFIYIFMLTSKIGNAFIPYYVYFSSL